MPASPLELNFGQPDPWRFEFDGDRFRSFHSGPAPLADPASAVAAALSQPLDFPPLTSMCVPGDRVVLVVDHQLSAASFVLKEVIQRVLAAGADPSLLTLMQPVGPACRPTGELQRELPAETASQVTWKPHSPDITEQLGYLASSGSGDRIYLSRELLDADLVIPIFSGEFDAMTGYRSAGGLIYPGLSNREALAKLRGEGHRELRPENDRPLRQLGEEICWLLGIQFAVGIVPSRLPGQAAAILAGQWESVQRNVQQWLDRAWTVQLNQRAETVVLAIGAAEGRVSWNEVGKALALGQNLVVRDGRIIVLSSLAELPGPGLEILRSSRSAKAALQTLRQEAPEDFESSIQVASAAAWANVSLLSRLEASQVEDLQLTPLSSLSEAERLIGLCEDVVLIDGSEHTWGEIVEE